MAHTQLFASFMLDKSEGLEIALRAECVAEATPLNGNLQPLPASHGFVEGIMHLRDEVVPIINLKKRLGLGDESYGDEPKVAVVRLLNKRYGLLFEDIKEVFATGDADVEEVDTALQSEDKIISALILRERGKRVVELMELSGLFRDGSLDIEDAGLTGQFVQGDVKETTYSRYVVFVFRGQLYGIPVEFIQEITFFDAIKQMYRGVDASIQKPSSTLDEILRHGDIDGTLTLRGRTIPVLNACRLLSGENGSGEDVIGEATRVLVLANDGCQVGVVVEEIKAIEAIPENEVLPIDLGPDGTVSGIYQKSDGNNVTLLNVANLVRDRLSELQAINRLSNGVEEPKQEKEEPLKKDGTHHLITENCYLVFDIGKNMAVQLKDVQEIIDKDAVLTIPGESGFRSGVINLRGLVVPVINLQKFFSCNDETKEQPDKKLVICRAGTRTIALEVETIVTIYKQEKYQHTTSLNPELERVQDVLDRLIVFDNGANSREHVLVLNIHNMIRNHIDVVSST